MKLNVQKRLAASVLKASEKRVKFDPERLSEIKEAITKHDITGLVNKGAIGVVPVRSTSRGRARKIRIQKSKGRMKGKGSKKGKATARANPKLGWMNRIRLQREFLKDLRTKSLISIKSYHDLYGKAKGGFFRSRRHVKIYIEENDMFVKKQ